MVLRRTTKAPTTSTSTSTPFQLGPGGKATPKGYRYPPPPPPKTSSTSFAFPPLPNANSTPYKFAPVPKVESVPLKYAPAPKSRTVPMKYAPGPKTEDSRNQFFPRSKQNGPGPRGVLPKSLGPHKSKGTGPKSAGPFNPFISPAPYGWSQPPKTASTLGFPPPSSASSIPYWFVPSVQEESRNPALTRSKQEEARITAFTRSKQEEARITAFNRSKQKGTAPPASGPFNPFVGGGPKTGSTSYMGNGPKIGSTSYMGPGPKTANSFMGPGPKTANSFMGSGPKTASTPYRYAPAPKTADYANAFPTRSKQSAHPPPKCSEEPINFNPFHGHGSKKTASTSCKGSGISTESSSSCPSTPDGAGDGDGPGILPSISKPKPQLSPRGRETLEKLRLELNRSRLDNEASERRIARMCRKIQELDAFKEQAKELRKEIAELEKRYLKMVRENKGLKKKLGIEEEVEVEKVENPKETKEDKDKEKERAYVAKIKELTEKSDQLSKDYNKWLKQLKENQHQFMDALSLSDKDLVQSVANGGIGESSRTCGPVKLHAFIRKRVEKLKSEHTAMLRDVSDIRSQLNEEIVKCEVHAKHVSTLEDDKRRLLETSRGHQSQIQHLSVEINTLRSILDSQLPREREAIIKELRQENGELQRELDRQAATFEAQVAQLERDIDFEQRRYDALESLNMDEREETEKRWKKLWDERSERMKDDVANLRLNFETPLVISHNREEELKTEYAQLFTRYNDSKKEWERYRVSLFNQVVQWREVNEKKCEMLEELGKEKAKVEEVLTETKAELLKCQTTVNDGIAERILLQKNIENLQKQMVALLDSNSSGQSLTIDLSLLSQTQSWFTIGDYRRIKEEAIRQAEADARAREVEATAARIFPSPPGPRQV